MDSCCCRNAQAGSAFIAVFWMTRERVVSTAVCRYLSRGACDVSARKAAMIGYGDGTRNCSSFVRECEVEASLWVGGILNGC